MAETATREEPNVADFNMTILGIGWAGEWCPDPQNCEAEHCYASMGSDARRIHPLEPENFQAWVDGGKRFSQMPEHLRIGSERSWRGALESQGEESDG